MNTQIEENPNIYGAVCEVLPDFKPTAPNTLLTESSLSQLVKELHIRQRSLEGKIHFINQRSNHNAMRLAGLESRLANESICSIS